MAVQLGCNRVVELWRMGKCENEVLLEVHLKRSKLKWILKLMLVMAVFVQVDREGRDEVSSEVLVQKMTEQKMDLPLKMKSKENVKKTKFSLFFTAHFQYNPNSRLVEVVVLLAPF